MRPDSCRNPSGPGLRGGFAPMIGQQRDAGGQPGREKDRAAR